MSDGHRPGVDRLSPSSEANLAFSLSLGPIGGQVLLFGEGRWPILDIERGFTCISLLDALNLLKDSQASEVLTTQLTVSEDWADQGEKARLSDVTLPNPLRAKIGL